jgi:PAS domain-containing protein
LKKTTELSEKERKATNEELLREIAERKKIENALNENNKLLKSILDGSSSISIISTDRDGKILFWNTGAQRLFGYTPEEAIGKLTMSSLYPDDRETHKKEERNESGDQGENKGWADSVDQAHCMPEV